MEQRVPADLIRDDTRELSPPFWSPLKRSQAASILLFDGVCVMM